ncbi:hypothetical protein NP233_g5374 [Leucocoprinus birnbaumii]|uniref:Gamma-butyrobetaine dioxygenase n=1 Tax=Leucocoprinus birnbaumii TaxID=56174 RepID=A0AAD5VT04_9AGAR|nr:hypothetical protein NP233_g5374 [Leucocoprinus birnbaumii]
MFARTIASTHSGRVLEHIGTSIQRPKRGWSSITPAQTGITIHALNNTTFPYIWLRDSCQSSIHPGVKTKLHRTSDIPHDIRPASLSSDGIRLSATELEIKWSDGHSSVFPRSFLELHSDKAKLHEFHGNLVEEAWDNQSIQRTNLFIPYEELLTVHGLARAFDQLGKYGLLLVSGVPNEKTGNDECELRRLAEMFGEIRYTFYGSLWDVVNRKTESKNIAYTNLNLGLHMDLLYFQHPPRYQILHCLRNRVEGGKSIFVDALAAAETLRKTNPGYLDILAKTPVPFHYINDGHHLFQEHTTIELAPASTTSPERRIGHINYSPYAQAPLPLDTPQEFYSALKEFSRLLHEPNNIYEYTLREGDAALFDNRRVLHARTAFHDGGDETLKIGEARRWLKGCYLEADAILDRGRILRKQLAA